MPDQPVASADAVEWRAGLGPLAPLLADATVSEIMVNGPERIFVERKGAITRVPARFESAAALDAMVRGLAASLGKTLDAKNPFVDGRLPDGSRFNAVVAPVAVDPTTTAFVALRERPRCQTTMASARAEALESGLGEPKAQRLAHVSHRSTVRYAIV